jgi:hypothetical protein
MSKLQLAIVVAGLLVVGSVQASADTLLTAPLGNPATFNYNNASYSDALYSSFEYAEFTLSAPATITGMQWVGWYASDGYPTTPTFSYEILKDNSGTPISPTTGITTNSENYGGTALTNLTYSNTGMPYASVDGFTADTSISLAAGSYWLSIYATDSISTSYLFNWAPTYAGTMYSLDGLDQGFDPNNWGIVANDAPAFALTGTASGVTPPPTTTPEPISMIFFGTGLVAVGGYVARRRMQRGA